MTFGVQRRNGSTAYCGSSDWRKPPKAHKKLLLSAHNNTMDSTKGAIPRNQKEMELSREGAHDPRSMAKIRHLANFSSS